MEWNLLAGAQLLFFGLGAWYFWRSSRRKGAGEGLRCEDNIVEMDSLTVYTVPVMLGKGIGFLGETFGSEWQLSESKVLDGGVVCSTYQIDKNL